MKLSNLNRVLEINQELQNIRRNMATLEKDPKSYSLSIACKDPKDGSSINLPMDDWTKNCFLGILNTRFYKLVEELVDLGVDVNPMPEAK